jgi:hypothetical protein
MSQENVDRFVEATEAFNRGDVEAWLGQYDTEVVFEPQVAEMEGAYVGHDGIRAFITNIGDLYEHFEVPASRRSGSRRTGAGLGDRYLNR